MVAQGCKPAGRYHKPSDWVTVVSTPLQASGFQPPADRNPGQQAGCFQGSSGSEIGLFLEAKSRNLKAKSWQLEAETRMLMSTEVVMIHSRTFVSSLRRSSPASLLILFLALAGSRPGWTQSQPQPQTQPPAQTQPDQATPDSGGPSGDSGVIALPKKKDTTEEPPPPAPATPKFKNPEGAGNFSLRVEVPEVNVDVGVLLEKTGQFVSNLKPGNFRVYEDGVQQKVTSFKRVEAPITALLLCEFAANRYTLIYDMRNADMRNAAFAFANQLRPQDYVALMTFDMRTQIVSDFTQDKSQIQQGINSLRMPSFSETNLFDALYEGIDRLDRIEGRKYIILIASGRDTFSKLTLDKILQKVKSARDITIFTVSTSGWLQAMSGGGGMRGAIRDMDYLQADNQMATFAKLTGGMSFVPRFIGEMPDIFSSINQNIRSKYQLVYRPSNAKQDGTYRKLRVELVDDEGQPLHIQDEKHKPLKYEIIARDGYRAKQEVE
jgi:VWFA-related protein